MPAEQHVVTRDFGGILVPVDVQNRILDALVNGAPFARSLTRLPTNRSVVGFPVASPEGWAWLNELEEIPTLTMNDEAYLVAVAKVAGLIDVSNEMMTDSAVNLTALFTTLLSDSLSRQLDIGLLDGTGPPQPAGVVAAAPTVTGPTLLAAVAEAVGDIGDAGGQADTIAMSGAAFAAANATTSTDGQLVHPNGFAASLGLRPVMVPGLTVTLVYDSTRIWFVLNRQLSEVNVSRDWHFNLDATTFRIKARGAVACPLPDKAIRKVSVAGQESSASRTAAKKTAG